MEGGLKGAKKTIFELVAELPARSVAIARMTFVPGASGTATAQLVEVGAEPKVWVALNPPACTITLLTPPASAAVPATFTALLVTWVKAADGEAIEMIGAWRSGGRFTVSAATELVM